MGITARYTHGIAASIVLRYKTEDSHHRVWIPCLGEVENANLAFFLRHAFLISGRHLKLAPRQGIQPGTAQRIPFQQFLQAGIHGIQRMTVGRQPGGNGGHLRLALFWTEANQLLWHPHRMMIDEGKYFAEQGALRIGLFPGKGWRGVLRGAVQRKLMVIDQFLAGQFPLRL